VRQVGIGGPPRSYLTEGEWPDGTVDGPVEARYAQALAQRLRDAIGQRSLREVGRAARIDHTTISAILAGRRWGDLVTIARLEQALGQSLWPDLIE